MEKFVCPFIFTSQYIPSCRKAVESRQVFWEKCPKPGWERTGWPLSLKYLRYLEIERVYSPLAVCESQQEKIQPFCWWTCRWREHVSQQKGWKSDDPGANGRRFRSGSPANSSRPAHQRMPTQPALRAYNGCVARSSRSASTTPARD